MAQTDRPDTHFAASVDRNQPRVSLPGGSLTEGHREPWQPVVLPGVEVTLPPEPVVPVGECLCCGHILPLAIWKDAPLAEVTHGVCQACQVMTQPNRGPCSTERGCRCVAA